MYKKPQTVAKSQPKTSYVAGCPEQRPPYVKCSCFNTKCMCGPLN